MKHFMQNILTGVAATLLLVSCSSLEIESPVDRQGDLVPADFVLSEFSEINPDIACSQVASSIYAKNKIWTDSTRKADTTLTLSAVKAMAATEDSLFMLDSAFLRTLYADCMNKTWDTSAVLSKAELASLVRFDLYGNSDDQGYLTNYLETQIDSSQIVETYEAFGKVEGRAYRYCTADDAKSVEKSVGLEGVINADATVDYTGYFFCAEPQAGSTPLFYVVE